MAVSRFCRDAARGVANWSDMCHSHGQARSHLGGAPNMRLFAARYGLNGGIRKRQNDQNRGKFDTGAQKGVLLNPSSKKLPRICLLAAEETSPSVLYGLYDVLSTAGAVYSELTSGKPGEKAL